LHCLGTRVLKKNLPLSQTIFPPDRFDEQLAPPPLISPRFMRGGGGLVKQTAANLFSKLAAAALLEPLLA
jgi:hypothetical protein